MEATKTCGTCKHWGTSEDAQENDRFRQCQAVDHDGSGMHYNFSTDDQSRQWQDEHKACVIDGSGYMAALMIREDFGCVLWEARSE